MQLVVEPDEGDGHSSLLLGGQLVEQNIFVLSIGFSDLSLHAVSLYSLFEEAF